MTESANALKATVAALTAALTGLWGWFGWLAVAWTVSMAIDYLTGTFSALRRGAWSSKLARDGLWHKLGCVAAVLVAGLLDFVVAELLANTAADQLPFVYTVFLCPMVLVWYILTEAGSIIENVGAMGAPLPKWLKKAVAALRDAVDAQGDRQTGQKEE